MIEYTPKRIFCTLRHEDAKIIHLYIITLRHCVLAYFMIIGLFRIRFNNSFTILSEYWIQSLIIFNSFIENNRRKGRFCKTFRFTYLHITKKQCGLLIQQCGLFFSGMSKNVLRSAVFIVLQIPILRLFTYLSNKPSGRWRAGIILIVICLKI